MTLTDTLKHSEREWREMDSRTPGCEECAKSPMEKNAILRWNYYASCHECEAKKEAEIELARKEERRSERLTQFEAICPPLYRESDPSRLHAECRKWMDWQPQPDGKGVGFIGAAGCGKTRAMFAILRRLLVDEDIKVAAISGTRLAKLAVLSWGGGGATDKECIEARERMKNLGTAQVLFLDDLGKEKYTERAEIELYDLLETRTSHMRPILWTSNCNAEVLSERLSETNAGAVLRRLAEFSEVIKIK